MENLDFENLADVSMIDEVQDTDTVLVVRDGEVFRADGSNLGGGGVYMVDVAADEFFDDGGDLIVKTPVPGLLDAMKNGANLIVKIDPGILLGEGEFGCPVYLMAEGFFVDYADLVIAVVGGGLSKEEIAEFRRLLDGAVVTGTSLGYEYHPVFMTNGCAYFEDEDSISTLSLDGDETETPLSKLKEAMAKVKEKLSGKLSGKLGGSL